MNYEKLFAVSYHHEYYKSKKFNGFRIRPSLNTNQLLKSYNLVLKQQETEFTVLFKEDAVGRSLMRKLKSPILLSFYVSSEDRIFLNYSNVSNEINGEIYWLNNLVDNENDKSLLHTGKYLGESTRVPFINSIGRFLSSLQNDEQVQVIDILDNVLFEGTVGELKKAERDELSNIGFARIKTQDKELEIYLKPPRLNHVIAVIDIVINPIGDKSFETIIGNNYRVNIDTRTTTWRYNIINRDNYDYSDFKIFSGKEIVPTSEVEQKVMLTGEKAYYLETKAPMRLQERYDIALELEVVKLQSDRNVKRRINLPYPDINKVKVARVDDTYQAYSEMYIYF